MKNQAELQLVGEALESIGITTSNSKPKIKKLSALQQRLRSAAAAYFTTPQAESLRVAGAHGWTGRGVVTNVKAKKCLVSIVNGNEVAWIDPNGEMKLESEIVKQSGALGQVAA